MPVSKHIDAPKLERYSFSKLSAFHECRAMYFMSYVQKQDGESNVFADYGSLVHGILEQYAKGELAVYELADAFRQGFYEQCYRPFPPNKYKDLSVSYYEDGVRFFENFEGLGAYEILGVEEEFLEPVDDDFLLHGFIDLVYRDENNTLVVHDWKSAADVKKDIEHKQKQLYIYSWYMKKKYGEFPKLLRWGLFRKQTDYTIEFNIDDYNKTMSWVKDTVHEIRRCFPPCPHGGFFCDWLCDFRYSCTLKGEQ